ncbi:MAG: CoA transferase [Deltaproteobacteria bacterium]|nr:CoA transferase [Deltaproteobacteria bacterium]
MTSALEGVRVLDLTRVWSGPLAGRILADLGAEVIQITGRVTVNTSALLPEVAKILAVFPDDDPGERPWNRTSLNNDLGRNKLGLTLELNTPEGIEIFKRLVKISDVVLENYSPRVMPNFGLDYPALKEINPAVIMCSMPGYGATGPYRDYVSYGTNLDPASGLASLMGYPGEGAHMSGNAYPDPVAALHATGAILTALFLQRRTGKGQYIDLSQAESATCVIGEAVLGCALNGKVPPRLGNRHPSEAPYGCYRCKGDDKWVVIAVSSDEEWAALGQAMGSPDWIKDARFASAISRREDQDAVDEKIEAWTGQHTHYEVMKMLQEAGVPAGAVLDAAELLADKHLLERDFFWEIDHPEVGPRKYCALPIKLSRTPARVRRPAPCLGEHNEYVLGELLGLSRDEIAQLEKKGIIGDRPID